MTFLSRQEVLRIHALLVDLYGGAAGIRDEGLLTSALAQPEASFDGVYLHTDLWEMAAAYGFHLTKNHPFLDGNKRVGLAVMLTFLELHGQPLRVDAGELYAVMIAVAEGRLSKSALAAWMREG